MIYGLGLCCPLALRLLACMAHLIGALYDAYGTSATVIPIRGRVLARSEEAVTERVQQHHT